MKKVLLLTLVMVLGASVAFGQAGVIGTYADTGALDCNIVDAAPSLLTIYFVHTLTAAATAIEYSAPVPACMVGATYLAWNAFFPVSPGNPIVGSPGPTPPPAAPGTSAAYGACLAGPIASGSVSIFGSGLSQLCCTYPVLPHQVTGTQFMVDCNVTKIPATAAHNTINGNATCDCNVVPTQDATWGAVKALYK